MNGELVTVKLPGTGGAQASNSKSRKALLGEGRVLRAVRHTRIVRFVEADSEGEYLAMEFLAGSSLFVQYSQDLPRPREAFEFAARIAEGLAALHRAGFLHLDLKPQNIMFRDEGNRDLVLIDLGGARPIDKRIGPGTLDSQMLGSHRYLFKAPEQLSRCDETFGAHTDAFALGVTLYWLLTGTTPFSNSSNLVSTAGERFRQEYACAVAKCLTMNLPLRAIAVIEQLLAIDPTDRTVSLDTIAAALADCGETTI